MNFVEAFIKAVLTVIVMALVSTVGAAIMLAIVAFWGLTGWLIFMTVLAITALTIAFMDL